MLAELMQQALLAGLCLQVVMPLAVELAADAGGVNMAVSCLFRVWPGGPAAG